MLNRRYLFGATALFATAALTACQPLTLPSNLGSTPSASSVSQAPTPTPDPTPTFPTMPADAMLGLIGTATASNGAVLNLVLTVHSVQPSTEPIAADGVNAISSWCVSESDASVLAATNSSILQVDFSATAQGSVAWPSDLPIALFPSSSQTLPVSLAATGGIKQLEVLGTAPSPGDYIPHCQQSAFLTGPGTGSLTVAISNDVKGTSGYAPMQAWSGLWYGFDGAVAAGTLKGQPFGGADPKSIVFSNCQVVLTQVGSNSGAPSPTWQQVFNSTSCGVGTTS
ncbi:MAG: hypothetical protein KF844_04555 [Cryobacterium sp.]|nr:hypothetical protein [Cryobacterium sp.]